ncbi:hypothetical protein EIN_182360, partial [Entamoeba invadens IP1]|uniref:hypothetical protein n=1 Tax=Entamoeba invadens IP1 TaxID=370355 RepID=UPI0002C3EAB0
TASSLPSSYLSNYQLPRYCQYDRGTCWAFATIGLLEQSYRENGIKKGFLKENEYVRLSPQAYAIDVMNECEKHKDACPDKQKLLNSTEGGYVEWLYAFTNLYDKILPESACPYAEENEGQWECENKEEKQKKNPLKFNVTNIVTKRTISDIKKLLYKTQKPVGFDSALIIGKYAIPSADHPMLRAFVSEIDGCPDNPNEECLYLDQHEMNPDGEFFIEDNQALSEGGHAMNIVGYNDEFTNKDGSKGAFVVRNSWLEAEYWPEKKQWIFHDKEQEKKFMTKFAKNAKADTADKKVKRDDPPPTPRNYYRGSHSQQYIMQQISEWDERTICPNANNIQNWDSCVNLATGPTKYGVKKDYKEQKKGAAIVDEKSACLNETFLNEYVANYRRPMEFTCLNQFTDELCSQDDIDNSRFFLTHKSPSTINPNLVNFCMVRVNKNDITIQKEFCVNDVPFDYVEFLFMPVQNQMEALKNKEDLCGFNIWPYAYMDKSIKYRGFFDVIHFAITWDDQSYTANKVDGLDYQYVESSKHTQEAFPEFMGPEPYQKRFYE